MGRNSVLAASLRPFIPVSEEQGHGAERWARARGTRLCRAAPSDPADPGILTNKQIYINLLSISHGFLDTRQIPKKGDSEAEVGAGSSRVPCPAPSGCHCGGHLTPNTTSLRAAALTVPPFLYQFQWTAFVAEFHQKDVKKFWGNFRRPFE